MKIFIDFDDVLFNTREFISKYRNIFYSYKITKEQFDKFYYDYPVKTKTRGLLKYDSSEHVKRLHGQLGSKAKLLKRDVDKLLSDLSGYIFSDVKDFLKNFKKGELFLVSYGLTNFQKMKIKNSGLKRYFKKISIIDEMKSVEIRKILKKNKDKKIFFIDDRVEQVTNVKKNVPGIITFFMKRKEGRYKDKKNKFCDFEVKNLTETKKIIEKFL